MRRPIVLATALLGLLAVSGAALAVGGLGQARQGVPLVKVHFEFKVEERATHYTVANTGDSRGSLDLAGATYSWKLTPPDNDPACNNRGVLTGTGKEFVWRHGNKGDPISDDACDHDIGLPGIGHPGDVDVVVKDAKWSCTADYTGTQAADGSPTGDGPNGDCTNLAPPPAKAPSCDDEKAALAAANAREDAALAAIDAFRPKYREALKRLDEAYEALQAARQTVIGFGVQYAKFMLPFINDANDDWDEADKLFIPVQAVLDALAAEAGAASKARRRAEETLAKCLKGSPRGSQRVAAPTVCVSQQVALAVASARLSVYRKVSRAFGRVDLASVRSRALEMRESLTRGSSKAPSGLDGQKAVKAMTAAAAAAGRAAAAVAKLETVYGNYASKVKPAQQQVAKAKAALAACQK